MAEDAVIAGRRQEREAEKRGDGKWVKKYTANTTNDDDDDVRQAGQSFEGPSDETFPIEIQAMATAASAKREEWRQSEHEYTDSPNGHKEIASATNASPEGTAAAAEGLIVVSGPQPADFTRHGRHAADFTLTLTHSDSGYTNC